MKLSTETKEETEYIKLEPVELRNNLGIFYVPFEDYIENKKPLWKTGFTSYEITVHNRNHISIGYEEESETHWGDFYIDIYIENKKVILKGKGSRMFKERILNAYTWFIKARNDSRYRELFEASWF